MRLRQAVLGVAALFLLGCGGGPPVKESELSLHPEGGKVALVIMRPGHHLPGQARAPRTALFRITPDGQEFIGLLNKGEKLTYVSPPGDQLFMVIGGENADFMEAHLDAGKTYYAFVKPRAGVLRPRFSLFPVRRDPEDKLSTSSGDFRDCFAECGERDVGENQRWYEANKPSIDHKREAFMRRWDARGDEYKGRQIMNREDGA